jgi:hypothetical protein
VPRPSPDASGPDPSSYAAARGSRADVTNHVNVAIL